MGGSTYFAAQKFCKPGNIDSNSAYARKGVTVHVSKTKARAYILSKNCEPGVPLVSTQDCMRQFMFTCRAEDKQGYGTVRASAWGCLTFGIARS